MMRRSFALALLIAPLLAQAQADVLTRRYNNLRSGVNDRETILTQSNVRTNFGKLWTLYADAKIMAQPLYVANLVVPAASIVGSTAKTKCAAGCNAVIFATMKGTLYAYMADQKPSTVNDTLLWAIYLSDGNACQCGATGPQIGDGKFDMWAVDDPWWGILSTPVIDRTSNSLYVVNWTNDQQYRIYNVNITTGRIQKGPVVVQGTIGNLTFQFNGGSPQVRKQRAGLLLANGLLYVGFGGDNQGALAGWLFVYDAATLTMKTVWSPTPKGKNGGIWMAGDAPAADAAGNIYLQSGDGDFDSSPGVQSYGDSLLKLNWQNGALTVAGFFAPCNQAVIRFCDFDQGSSGPLLFDEFIVGGGKNGQLYLMRADKLAGNTAPASPLPHPADPNNCVPGVADCKDSADLIQKWQASKGHIHGSPVLWKGPNNKATLFIMGEADKLKAFPFENGKFNLAAAKVGGWAQPKLTQVPFCQSQQNHGMWMPGGYLGVSSNAMNAGTGIVWALVPANGDANSCRGVKGMLLALSAEDVTQELWRSQAKNATASDTPDSFGLLARFNPPTIAGGKVFIGTAGDAERLQHYQGPRPAQAGPANNYLAVYGLKQ